MKRILSIIICTLLLTSAGWAQVRMTDTQVMQFVLKERAKGTSQSQIVSRLMQRGVTAAQIRRQEGKEIPGRRSDNWRD